MKKIFEYPITQERVLSDLIALRFKYIIDRTGLSISEFIDKRLTCNNKKIAIDSILMVGETLQHVHLASDEKKVDTRFDTIYEDEFIIAIEKPNFMPVVPRSSHYFTSLCYTVWEKYNKNYTPLHRLDIETTGVMLFAKHQNLTAEFHKIFREKKIKKKYDALVYGHFPEEIKDIEGFIEKDKDSEILSKHKLTYDESNSESIIHKIEYFLDYSRIEIEPVSGKTNQLRIHLSAKGFPIIGDKKYYFTEDIYLDWLNTKNDHIDKMILDSQALHAKEIEFFHP